MLKNISKVIPLLFLTPLLAIAEQKEAAMHSFLSGGFDINDYKTCHRFIEKCPFEGPMPSDACIKKITRDQPACDQLKQLAKALGFSPAQLSFKRINHFVIANVSFSADAQNQYFIITPGGHLIDTVIDPRSIDDQLKNKYKKTDFVMVNTNPPRFKLHSDGSKTISVRLRITKNCLACELIGWAIIDFNFDKTNTLKNISLENFKQQDQISE